MKVNMISTAHDVSLDVEYPTQKVPRIFIPLETYLFIQPLCHTTTRSLQPLERTMATAKVTGMASAAAINTFSNDKYVRVDDPAVEPEVPNEAELQHEIRQIISRVQDHNFSMHRHGMRATHVKTQAIVKGMFTVAPDLPEYLAQGICSPANAKQPHPVAIRFANEPSFLQDDGAPGPRGCGMKVFNVEGSFMDPAGDRTKTQDFTFNNAPVLELRDVKTCVEVFTIREAHFREPEKIAPKMKKRRDAQLQMAPTQLPNQHFLSYTMYSQSVYRWGPYVVKYALFPGTQMQQDLASQTVQDGSDPEVHSQWLKRYFEEHDAEYDFKVQLCQSVREQSVEDTSVQWDETAFPFQTVGRIVLPKGQDSFDAQRRTFWDDRVKLNVFYGLEDHRPLGSVNRLRKELYNLSSKNRGKTNAVEILEIGSVDQIP